MDRPGSARNGTPRPGPDTKTSVPRTARLRRAAKSFRESPSLVRAQQLDATQGHAKLPGIGLFPPWIDEQWFDIADDLQRGLVAQVDAADIERFLPEPLYNRSLFVGFFVEQLMIVYHDPHGPEFRQT